MKRYDSYKDSGVDWIGEIPEHWRGKRLKNIGSLYSGLTGKSGVDFSTEPGPNKKPFINFTNVANNKYIVSDNFGFVTFNENEKQNLVKKGDLLFLMSSENQVDVGKSSLLVEDYGELYVNSFCKGFRISTDSNVDPFFLNYALNSSIYSQLISLEGRGFTRINLRMEGIENLPVFFPDLKEQILISNFLEEKTSDIENLIEKKKKLISFLKEERTAIINHAVTRGINSKIKLKDSGVEWIEKIPEHWKISSFRYCINVLTDFTANGSFATLAKNVSYLDSGHSRLVRLTDLRVDLNNEGVYVDENAHNFLKKSELFGGEMLIANVGAYAGLVKLMPFLKGKFTLGPNMFLLKLNQNTEFFYYQLNAHFCSEQLKLKAISSAQPKLNKNDIRELKIIVPPIKEQKLILNYIKEKTSDIDLIIIKTEKEINLLQEYKTALISEAVTGKIDVREAILN